MSNLNDPVLNSIVRALKSKYRCHTIILYGSRARGLITPTSDYDVIGVRRHGRKTRIAKKQKGYYWDVFVYSEKDLRKLGDPHLSWKNAQILYENGTYGRNLLRRLHILLKKPHRPAPQYEINVTKAWAQKELDRCRAAGIQGLYRRVEFLSSLVADYFFVRKKRFWGPKEGFAWIEENDPKTFKRIQQALKSPNNLILLSVAASRVYQVELN